MTQKIDSVWTDSTFTEKIQGGREQEEENERKMGLIFREFLGPRFLVNGANILGIGGSGFGSLGQFLGVHHLKTSFFEKLGAVNHPQWFRNCKLQLNGR